MSVEKSYEERVCDIHTIVYVDSNILNFSQTLPGKLLGSTLSVGNFTEAEQIVELSIETSTFNFNRQLINKKFGDPVLPFNLSESKTDNILNSEIKDHEGIWFIENPVSKELTKRITIKLGPKAEQEFVVVLKAPNTRRSTNLLSMISLSLLTYADEQFGIT